MENCVDAPSSLGEARPGEKVPVAAGPVAPSLPQLPHVSQLAVSCTLSRTVVPAGGAGVGLATGVGLGLGPGVGMAPGLGELPGVVVAGLLLAADIFPPQELQVNVAPAIKTA